MAEQNTSQEKTEQATPRKQEQARGKGQVARSKELGTAMVLFSAAIGFLIFGSNIGQGLFNLFSKLFSMSREMIFDKNQIFLIWSMVMSSLILPMVKLFSFIAFGAFVGNVVIGGITFSTDTILPKNSRMSPINGFKRMFGIQAIIELIKGIAKFFVVAICAYYLLSLYFDDILLLSNEASPNNIYHAMNLLLWMFVFLCFSMFFIVIIDVPFQIWNHNKQLRMTKQEIKDEFKDTDGKPEVKNRIRQLQRDLAQRRMMTEVPKADVIVINPEHYAVAIRYDVKRSSAPFVVAKGIDSIAFKIREIGQKYDVTIVSAPPLARAVYYTTKIDQEIPDGLFTAVAQVLAYVYQLREYTRGKGRKPTPIPENQPIPNDLKH